GRALPREQRGRSPHKRTRRASRPRESCRCSPRTCRPRSPHHLYKFLRRPHERHVMVNAAQVESMRVHRHVVTLLNALLLMLRADRDALVHWSPLTLSCRVFETCASVIALWIVGMPLKNM